MPLPKNDNRSSTSLQFICHMSHVCTNMSYGHVTLDVAPIVTSERRQDLATGIRGTDGMRPQWFP